MSDFFKRKKRSNSSISAPQDFRCISHVDENSTLRDALIVMSNGRYLDDRAVHVTKDYSTEGRKSRLRESLESGEPRVGFGEQCVPLPANPEDYGCGVYANVPFVCSPSISSSYGNSSPRLMRHGNGSTQELYAMQNGAIYPSWINNAGKNSPIMAAKPRMSPAGTVSQQDSSSFWLNGADITGQPHTCNPWMNPSGISNPGNGGSSQISLVETTGQLNPGYPRMTHAESNNSLSRQHQPLQRTRSKSFSQLGEAVSHGCSCTVCKQRVITNKLYFPISTLRSRDKNTFKKEQKASTGEDKPPANKNTMPDGVVLRKGKTTKEVPSPPPRGILRAESNTSKELEYSVIKSCSYSNLSADCLEITTCEQVAQNNDNVMPPEEESEDEDSGRVSITSITEDEEMTITRL